MSGHTKRKVLLGMSGGMDSSMAAVLLQQQGYEVIGATLLTYADEELPGIQEARELARKLAIAHHTIDCKAAFEKEVIAYFVDDYLKGLTPNPCIRCNETIKWKYLLKWADQLDCQYISTGHYVQKTCTDNYHYIVKGVDPAKDQSYFLWNLSQEVIERAIFPLGQLHKKEVRELARSLGYTTFADKKESMGVCFLSGTNYKEFLTDLLPSDHFALQPGDVINADNQIITNHKGYPFYTLGQRKGIEGIEAGQCVVAIDPKTNRLQTGPRNTLYDTQVALPHFQITTDTTLWQNRNVFIRVRGIDSVPGYNGTVSIENNALVVRFETPVWGMMPGQSIVIYQSDHLIGGGIVDRLDSQTSIKSSINL